VTITLSIAPTPFAGSTSTGRTGDTTAGIAFGGVLDAELGVSGEAIRTAFRTLRAPEAVPSETGAALATDLDSALTRLTEQLAALEDALGDDKPLDPDLLALVEGLMTQLRTVLGEAGALEPSAPASALRQGVTGGLEALAGLPADLRQTLADKLETVAGALTRLSGALDEDALPRLDGFARLLDKASAALSPAETPADPDTLLKLARSETAQDTPAAAEPGKDSGQSRDTRAQAAPDTAPRIRPGESGPAANPAQGADDALAALAHRSDESADIAITATAPQAATQAASTTQAGPTAYVRPETQVNMPFIAAEIARHVQNGVPRFEIRLNPPEMGRIDVRLEFDPSGNVTARLAVERSETLDLMQRDQRTLERMLAQAGIDSGKTSLEFSLKQNGSQHGGGFEEEARHPAPSGRPDAGPAEAEPQRAPTAIYRGYVRADAVNLWI